jgi:hypothetical protein
MDSVHNETNSPRRELDNLDFAKVVEQLANTNFYLAKVHEVLLETRSIWQNYPFSGILNASGLLPSRGSIADDVEKGMGLNSQRTPLLGPVSISHGSNPPPPEAEKKKPIKFEDAIRRKYSFPFELCATWAVRIATRSRGMHS